MGRTKRTLLVSLACAAAFVLSACDTGSTRVSGGVYYDSMLWNDYYYGSYRPGYRPPPDRPVRPDRPDRPDRPVRPPGGGIDPGFSRPPAANRPIHRPSGGGGGLRGRR
jgi:hypothetical protein